jgi:hypothetical protein
MFYFNRQGVNITIMDDAKAIRDIAIYEPLILSAMNDLRLIKDTSDVEVNRHENAPFYEVKSEHGRDDIIIYPQRGGKKRVERPRRSRRQSYPAPAYEMFNGNYTDGYFLCSSISWGAPNFYDKCETDIPTSPKMVARLLQETSGAYQRGDEEAFEKVVFYPLKNLSTPIETDEDTQTDETIIEPCRWSPGKPPDDLSTLDECAGADVSAPIIGCSYQVYGTGYWIQECIGWPTFQDGIRRNNDLWDFHYTPPPNPLNGGACVHNYAMTYLDTEGCWEPGSAPYWTGFEFIIVRGVGGYWTRGLDSHFLCIQTLWANFTWFEP